MRPWATMCMIRAVRPDQSMLTYASYKKQLNITFDAVQARENLNQLFILSGHHGFCALTTCMALTWQAESRTR
jgi:hypothetical protein